MQAINTPEFIQFINNIPPQTKIELECPECLKPFFRSKNVIQSKFGKYNKNNKIYCSFECSAKHKTYAKNVLCKQCNKNFIKSLNQIKKIKNHFCSRSCAAKYNNTHKVKGYRRSKLEQWLEITIKKIFPNIEMICNGTDINHELDIYFPKLKLAVELNGIFHYKAIYGINKLISTQDNDNKKIQACLEANIHLLIIDTSFQKRFTPKTSTKFLNEICNEINLRLKSSGE